MIELVFAHPYPQRSRANRVLLDVRDLPDLEVRSLYDLYPDFAIDLEAEQAALLRAESVVWQHPLYWYSMPPAIKDADAPVIIAGFGRFGQIVGRLLFANRIKVTVLDHDPEQVEFLRRFGFRVFYGDATRVDLLRAAGAGQARLLINAIDDVDASLALTDLVRENFPSLRVVARARNVSHYFELRARGVEVVERETFESALTAGRRALVTLGVAPYEAREQADRFRQHNVRALEGMLPNYRDEVSRLSQARAGREDQFERDQFERDRVERDRIGTAMGWQEGLDSASKERS